MNAEYLIFHELTHIWDAEVFSQRDKLKHMSNKGYTEYHAAQIDFMKLLKAKNIAEPFAFSMKQTVETFSGTKTAKEFVDMPRNLATELINRTDFPASIETFATTMGAIFNYYGRQSICKMYATDYIADEDMSTITGFIGENNIKALDDLMHGWFDTTRVSIIDAIYRKMVVVLVQENKLA